MRTALLLTSLSLSALLSSAQVIESNRVLVSGYQPQLVEQALTNLTATNKVDMGRQVEYKAGQVISLLPGFEARVGSVFTAHTGFVTQGESTALRVTAHPNPFDEVTIINYVLSRASRTSLHIRDTEGKLVAQLVYGQYQPVGAYRVEWKAGHLPAGVYLYTLETGSQQVSKRIVRK